MTDYQKGYNDCFAIFADAEKRAMHILDNARNVSELQDAIIVFQDAMHRANPLFQ